MRPAIDAHPCMIPALGCHVPPAAHDGGRLAEASGIWPAGTCSQSRKRADVPIHLRSSR